MPTCRVTSSNVTTGSTSYLLSQHPSTRDGQGHKPISKCEETEIYLAQHSTLLCLFRRRTGTYCIYSDLKQDALPAPGWRKKSHALDSSTKGQGEQRAAAARTLALSPGWGQSQTHSSCLLPHFHLPFPASVPPPIRCSSASALAAFLPGHKAQGNFIPCLANQQHCCCCMAQQGLHIKVLCSMTQQGTQTDHLTERGGGKK